MSQLAQAAITKYHNGVGWKNRHLFPHSFGGQNSEMRVISLLRFYRRLSSGLQMLTFLSCPNMAERRRKPSGLFSSVQFSSVQSLSRVRLFATPWIAACQASLPITNSRSSPRLIHQVGDAIQPSHPQSSPSSPAPNPSQHQSLFQWVNSLHEVAKVQEFQL